MPVNGSLQTAGFVMALLGLILTLVACLQPQWKQNDRSGEVIEVIRKYEGLWKKCTERNVGYNACDYFDHFIIGLPRLLLAGRVFTCFSVVFFFFGTLISLFGLNCIQLGSESNDSQKAKMTVAGGFCNLLGALLIGIAVSWYAAEVSQQWHYGPNAPMSGMGTFGGSRGGSFGGSNVSPEYRNNELYVLGYSLFIGWGAMAIGLGGAIMGICSSWGAMNEEDDVEDGFGAPYKGNTGYSGGYARDDQARNYV